MFCRLYKYYFFLLILLVLFVSCRNQGHSPRPGESWTPISPAADSLTLALEDAFINDVSYDSIDAMTDAFTDGERNVTKALKCRQLYWKGRRMDKSGFPDSAFTLLENALSLADSVNAPYDYHRIRIVHDRLSQLLPVERYLHLIDDDAFFNAVGDSMMAANVAQQLGNIFVTTLQYNDALTHYLKADSLLNSRRLQTYRLKNRINIAMAYRYIGDSMSADSTLRPLLSDSRVLSDRQATILVLRDMHVITGNRDFILRAYRMLKNEKADPGTEAVFEAILSYDYNRAGIADSADLYAAASYAKINKAPDLYWREMILRNYARRLERAGRGDSLIPIQKIHILTLDSLQLSRQTQEVGSLEHERDIRIVTDRIELQRQREKSRLMAILACCIAVAAIAVVILVRRNARQKLRHMKFLIETERNRRRLLSLSMMMTEKDSLMSAVRKEVESINSTNPTAAGARLEAMLRQSESEKINRQQFFEAFEKLNPRFVPELKKKCPKVSESLLQIACLIVTGVDNRRISEMMNVRPASVNQSRWRLRSLLNLEKEDSLEEYLRSLV